MKHSAFILLAFVGLLFTSCKKDDPILTEQETVDMIEASLSAGEQGLASDISTTAQKTAQKEDAYANNCNFTGDSTFTFSASGVRFTANFNYDYNWFVTCDGIIPVALSYTTTRSGNYDGLRVDYNGNASGLLIFTDILSGSAYTLNGSHNFSGNTVWNRVAGDDRTASATLEVALSNIKVDKTTFEILSGTATVSLSASNNDDSISFSGTINFEGGGAATVTINGNNYAITIS